MIRKIFLSLSIFCLTSSYAGHGIITSLEIPILQKPDIDSHVVQRARKGQKIYIHDKHFKNGPLEIVYQREDSKPTTQKEIEEDPYLYEQFYETKDRNGNRAYVSQYFVKLITEDIREFEQRISPFDPDPNDYRLSEPLPENYPLVDKEKYRARFSLNIGPDLRTNYNYNDVLTEEDFSNRYGVNLSFSRKAGWDKQDRFYFGGLFHAWTAVSKFELFSNRSSKEYKSQLGIGPFVSYDAWRGKDYKISVETSISFSYTRHLVEQNGAFGNREQRLFSSLSFVPRIATYAQHPSPIKNVDFIFGAQAQFYLPHALSSDAPVSDPDLWNEAGSSNDSVSVPFTAQYSLFLGIQGHY